MQVGMGDKQYHIEIVIKFMLITMKSVGHFYSVWINITAEINMTTVLSDTQTQTHATLTVFSAHTLTASSIYENIPLLLQTVLRVTDMSCSEQTSLITYDYDSC